MSKAVYNVVKLCGLSGVLNSSNAECVRRLYSHDNWYKKMGRSRQLSDSMVDLKIIVQQA